MFWEPSSPIFAGFWKRLSAHILDFFFLVFMVFLLLTAIVTGAYMMGVPLDTIESWLEAREGTSRGIGSWLMDASLTLLYFSIMESSPLQATLGKLALGIKVTDMGYRRLSFWNALGRNLCKVFSFMILGLGFLMTGWTSRKQGLHDYATDCLVVCRCARPIDRQGP